MHKSTKFRQRGLSLIEVLISLVIFAFGLLAAAGLQLASLKSSQFSAQAVNATLFARDYGETMQVVPDWAISTSSGGTNTFFIDTSATSTADASACTGNTKDCSPQELATALVRDWSLRVGKGLPGGRAEVCRDATPRDSGGALQWGGCDGDGAMALIKVGWTSKSNSGGDSGSSGTSWMSADRPRLAMAVLGNNTDYARADAE
jgi:type IV pilus assembly protein PilV